jgi:hypothetical protein
MDVSVTSQPITVTATGASVSATVTSSSSSVSASGGVGPQGAAGPAGQQGASGASAWNDITGKPSTFAPSAHTHSQADVTGLVDALAGKQAAGSYAAASHTHTAGQVTGLAAVATSGSYADLSNRPSIPSAYSLPVATGAVLGGVKQGSNVTIGADGTVSVAAPVTTLAAGAITGLATVATSGAYADLSGKPTLFSGSYADLLSVPASFAPSAHNQAWSTITSTPTTLSGYGITDAVGSSDSRLSDARTPTSHTHALSSLTQSGATSGQVVAWSGSAWAPATPSAGGSSLAAYATTASFPGTGSTTALYLSIDSGRVYQWTGSVYAEVGPIGGGLSWADVPALTTSSGTAGQLAYDNANGFLYVATAASTWKRVALSTWVPWTPASITGLQLWLDASSSETLYDATSGGSLVAADGAVARWQDKSGSAIHATQATSGSRPLRKTNAQNGLDVVRMDGSNDYLEIPSTDLATNFTMFWAFRPNTVNYTLLATTTGGGARFLVIGTTLYNDYYGSGAATIATTGTTGTGILRTYRRSSGTLQSWLGGVSQGTVSFGNTLSGHTQIGRIHDQSTYNLSGDMYEVLIYNSALSDTDCSTVQSYLTAKWGL